MKVEKKAPEFAPVTITLEAQGEVDLLVAVLSCFGGNHEDDMIYRMYKQLNESGASSSGKYSSRGDVIINEKVEGF